MSDFIIELDLAIQSFLNKERDEIFNIIKKYKNEGMSQEECYNEIIKLHRMYKKENNEDKLDVLVGISDDVAGFSYASKFLWDKYLDLGDST